MIETPVTQDDIDKGGVCPECSDFHEMCDDCEMELDCDGECVDCDYPEDDDDERAARVENAIRMVATQKKLETYQSRHSLARDTYEVAKRLGWQPGERQAPAARREPERGKAGALRKSVQRQSPAGGGKVSRPSSTLDVETLLNMDPDEFDEVTKGDRWKKVAAAIG